MASTGISRVVRAFAPSRPGTKSSDAIRFGRVRQAFLEGAGDSNQCRVLTSLHSLSILNASPSGSTALFPNSRSPRQEMTPEVIFQVPRPVVQRPCSSEVLFWAGDGTVARVSFENLIQPCSSSCPCGWPVRSLSSPWDEGRFAMLFF